MDKVVGLVKAELEDPVPDVEVDEKGALRELELVEVEILDCGELCPADREVVERELLVMDVDCETLCEVEGVELVTELLDCADVRLLDCEAVDIGLLPVDPDCDSLCDLVDEDTVLMMEEVLVDIV